MALPKEEEKYSWEDYLSWPEDDRFELIEGEAWAMSPGPTTEHQWLSGDLFGYIWAYLKGKPCDAFHPPTDLKLSLPEEDGTPTVLQPDIMVVCDKSKIGKQAIEGAPDLIIEILSDSTAQRDEVVKKRLYEKAGVLEYWIVYPGEGYIVRHQLIDGAFGEPDYFTRKSVITSSSIEGLEIELKDIFRP